MNILAPIKREERKLEKQLSRLNHQLSGVRAAAKGRTKNDRACKHCAALQSVKSSA